MCDAVQSMINVVVIEIEGKTMEKRFAINERGLRIGEDHQNARYTNGEVDMVHQLRDNGWGYKRISQAVEMPLRTVRDICNGRRRCQTTAGWRSA